MPSVDVAIPCYNYAHFLPDAVASVLSQEVDELRILIIDNASTDGSAEIASGLAERHAEIRVSVHERNLGATASYNEGIDWAEADYFLLLDADDMLAPGALRRAIRIMEQKPGVVFTYGIELHCPDGIVTKPLSDKEDASWTISSGRQFIEELCRIPIDIVGPNTVVRRTSAQKSAGHYRDTLHYYDDLELWLRLAMLGDVANTGEIQALRRIHTGQHSQQYRTQLQRDFHEREAAFMSFIAHEGKAFPNGSKLKHQVLTQLGKHAYWSSLSHYYRGHKDVAAELMRYARERRGLAGLVPPLDWLLSMNHPLERLIQILREGGAR